MPPKKSGFDAVEGYLAKNYGLSQAIIDSDTTDPAKGFTIKEALAQINSENLANNAAGHQKAANILAKTNWFQTYGVGITQRISQEKTASGVFNRQIGYAKNDIQAEANQLGYSLTDAQLTNLAKNSYIFGTAFNSNTVIKNIVNTGKISGGQAQNTIDTLKTHADEMGVQYNEQYFQDAAQSIANSETDLTHWQKDINELAKTRYGQWAGKIDAGMKVSTLASPYINSMSNILEIPASSISLTDPTINKALTYVDKNNQQTMQPFWEFEQNLKQDDRYFKTSQAKQDFLSLAGSIGNSFGRTM